MIEFTFSSKNFNKNKHTNVYGCIRNGHNYAYGTFSKYGNDAAIYGIKNKITNKVYIGSTIHIQRRLMKHFNELDHNRHKTKLLQQEYNKYGFTNFEIIIYNDKPNEKDLLNFERELQIQIGIDNLYNEKISGYWVTEELKQKYANASKATHKTKEYRNKMSKLKTNRIRQYDLAMNPIKDWESALQIVEELGYTRSVILSCCNGSKKRAYGYNWRYIDEYGNIILDGYQKARQIK